MNCDLSAVNIILTFAVGGMTLRGLLALVKNYFKLSGLLVVLLGIVMCAVASAVYMFAVGTFSWTCLLFYTCEVFVGTQVAYRATHKTK